MDHPIYTYEDRECEKHGKVQHMCWIQGHITWCFGPDEKDVPPPKHGIREVTCMACLGESWKDGSILAHAADSRYLTQYEEF
jgi:hypothetical protein